VLSLDSSELDVVYPECSRTKDRALQIIRHCNLLFADSGGRAVEGVGLLLISLVRVPQTAWMFVSCIYFVSNGFTRSGKSYRVFMFMCVCVCVCARARTRACVCGVSLCVR